ncbi:interferon-induced protein 44-like [Saccostrea cucullata]|uniref:interferon-induced protein 44-like n=1 Tax=Saccostrea cuccullata TaxID=36930 RepID=UPI002ED4798D
MGFWDWLRSLFGKKDEPEGQIKELKDKISRLDDELENVTQERDQFKWLLEETPLEKPWRYDEYENHEDDLFSQDTKDGILGNIDSTQFPANCRYINLLVVGLFGSGKSSFINTAKTVLRNSGEISTIAAVYGEYFDPLTEKLHEVVLKEFQDGKRLRIYDCRGIRADRGIQSHDLEKTINGFVRNDYRYNPENEIDENDESYRQNPVLEDEMHGVLFVADAEKFKEIENADIAIFRDLRQFLIEKGIPQRLILTKMDRLHLCKPDLRWIFKSRQAEERGDMATKAFNMQPNQVFPISNYVQESVQRIPHDILALKVIKNILDAACEYVEQR